MADTTHMKQVLQNYIDRFNQRDVTGIADLYAPDATIEDPVGCGNLLRGRDAITAFYEQAMQMSASLRLSGPIRGSHGNAAAMAFEVRLPGTQTIHVIDVMTFDDAGRIATMKAYWGPDDMV